MTEVTLPAPVKAFWTKKYFSKAGPGAFHVFKYDGDAEIAGLHFNCPCGCGVVAGIRFKLHPSQAKGECWTWNGDTKAPTVAPSIRMFDSKGGGTHWHGWLEAGYFHQ